jgi:hypothetical protein
MKTQRQMMGLIFMALLGLALTATRLHAQDTIVYNFQGPFATPIADGAYPNAGLVADSAGNLYGTASAGGNLGTSCPPTGCGVIYELTPSPGPSLPYTELVLYYFQGCGSSNCGSPGDGATPEDAMIIDSFSNLYGTTTQGGEGCNFNTGCGTVFVYCQSALGPYCSLLGVGEHVLATINPNASNGRHPFGPLVMDSVGNLFGTNFAGVVNANCGSGQVIPGCGSVFVVCAPNVTSGYDPAPCALGLSAPTYNEIYFFSGMPDGANPYGGMVITAKDILYGTTASGGVANSGAEPCARFVEQAVEPGCGTVFKLTPSGNATWTENVVYSFAGYPSDGSYPQGTLVTDNKGNLYGTTELGPLGGGLVFEVKPSTGAEKKLFKFTNRWDGGNVYAGLTFDPSSNYKTLYGATYSGGGANNGSVFELNLVGTTWEEPIVAYPLNSRTALWSFTSSTAVHGQCSPSSQFGGDGCSPFGGVIPVTLQGKSGPVKYLIGTTYEGGNGGNGPNTFNQGYGTVYIVTP